MATYPTDLDGYVGELNDLLKTASTSYAHWTTARKQALVNQARKRVGRTLRTIPDLGDHYFSSIAQLTPKNVGTHAILDLAQLYPEPKALTKLKKKSGERFIDCTIVQAHRAFDRTLAGLEAWWDIGGKLRNDDASITGDYFLLYSWNVSNLVKGDEKCNLPEEWQEAVPWCAAWLGAAEAKEADAERFKNEYESIMSTARGQANRVLKTMSRTVRQVESFDPSKPPNLAAFWSFFSYPTA